MMISWVPSVDPVSAITQVPMAGRTEFRHRQITAASFLTIQRGQSGWPAGCFAMLVRPAVGH
jgi:hypothetical protein